MREGAKGITELNQHRGKNWERKPRAALCNTGGRGEGVLHPSFSQVKGLVKSRGQGKEKVGQGGKSVSQVMLRRGVGACLKMKLNWCFRKGGGVSEGVKYERQRNFPSMCSLRGSGHEMDNFERRVGVGVACQN